MEDQKGLNDRYWERRKEAVSPQDREPTWHEQVLAAIAEAKGHPVYLGSAEVVVVPSQSDEMAFYYVLHFPLKDVCAECKGFRFRDHCAHVEDPRASVQESWGFHLTPGEAS